MNRQSGCRRPINGKPDTYNEVLDDLDRVLAAYEQVLWLYVEGICRCNPDRFYYLMNVELPFYLKPDVYADLEFLAKHIVNESLADLKVAA